SAPPLVTLLTVSPTLLNTPAASSAIQRKATATTVMMPAARDRMKAIFMTDQGSVRVTFSLARRGRRRTGVAGAGAGAGKVTGTAAGLGPTVSVAEVVGASSVLAPAPLRGVCLPLSRNADWSATRRRPNGGTTGMSSGIAGMIVVASSTVVAA